MDLCGASKKTKQNEIIECILSSHTHFFSFLAEVINVLHRIQNINSLKFQHYNNSFLWRFQAKELCFILTFIVNTLIIKINQKTCKQEKAIMYW